MQGRFIVLEGVDGAGTTTQASMLAEALRAKSFPVLLTCEPSSGPVGALLRQALSGRLVSMGFGGSRALHWQTMALLFAADRVDHLENQIVPNLRDGITVVCDRYDYSSVAYQSLTSGLGDEVVPWIREVNRHALRPDLTIVLNTSFEVAQARRDIRGNIEIFDEDDLQKHLGEFYAGLERHFPQDRIVHINADGDANEVASAVFSAVQE